MTSTVFIIDDNNALSPLHRTDYDSEDIFQRLLATYPELLSTIAGEGGRLLLVRREISVPDELTGAGRWSLDHLFLDQDGVPVLVEVKRSSDTRSRREVVAQMLDYAANGVAYWPIDQIIEAATSTAAAREENLEEILSQFANGGGSETFWRRVDSNLRSGRIRMVFVADRIPRELVRIVEFLNEQMRPAEILALELEQFQNESGLRMLLPRVVGQTSRAESVKTVSTSRPSLSVPEWLDSLRDQQGASAETVARKILDWALKAGLDPQVTSSADALALTVKLPTGKRAYPFSLRRSTGKLDTSLQYLAATQAYKDEDKRLELLTRFKQIPNADVTTTKSSGWPSIALEKLDEQRMWTAWTQIAADIIENLAKSG